MGKNGPNDEWLRAGTIVIGSGLVSGLIAYHLGAERRRRVKAVQYALGRVLATKWTQVYARVAAKTVMVIMGIESHFNPDVSNTNERAMQRGGAWGMMGMTLETAKSLVPAVASKAYHGQAVQWVAENLKLWNGSGTSLLQPDLNVMLGTFYLDRLAGEFNDFDLVVAAYHQGPANIRAQLAKGASKEQILAGLPPFGREYMTMAAAWQQELSQRNV